MISYKKIKRSLRKKKALSNLNSVTADNLCNYKIGFHGIIFSMDRACQLHALLSSFFKNVKEDIPLTVLYRSSNERHSKAYSELKEIFNSRKITWITENGFKDSLCLIINQIKTKALFFLVDDIIVSRPFNFSTFRTLDLFSYVPSLRLAPHLNYCYTQQQSMPLPPLEQTQSDKCNLLSWDWEQGELDWAYPLSVDGNIFLTAEIKSVIAELDFNAPNSFEGELQLLNDLFINRKGICFEKSCIINIPSNCVQTEVTNKHGDLDIEELLKKWEDKYQIDTGSLNNQLNISAHQELPIIFSKR